MQELNPFAVAKVKWEPFISSKPSPGDIYILPLPKIYDPIKHQVVMIDREAEQVICPGLKPVTSRCQEAREVYAEYLSYHEQSAYAMNTKEFESWWETLSEVNQQNVLQSWGIATSSFQERVRRDAFYFDLYVSPTF